MTELNALTFGIELWKNTKTLKKSRLKYDLAPSMNKKELVLFWEKKVQESALLNTRDLRFRFVGTCIPERASDRYMVCSFSDEKIIDSVTCFRKSNERIAVPTEIFFNSQGKVGLVIIQDIIRKRFQKLYTCELGDLNIHWDGKRIKAWFAFRANRPFDSRRYSRPYSSESRHDFKFYCGGESFQSTRYLKSVDLFLAPRSVFPTGSRKAPYRIDAYLGNAGRLTWGRQNQIALDFLKKYYQDLILLRDRYLTEFKCISFCKIVPDGALGEGISGSRIDHPGTILQGLRSLSQELGIELNTWAKVR